jgi:D-arabinose 1-dehydrogenase-like Zn-dependent alcohol dehydrogenase
MEPDAEYALIRSEAAVQIPEGVDAAKYAPLLCAGLTIFNSMRRMNISPGETVAIQGLGGLGHLAVQYAKRFGYRVVAISRGADKEQFARQLGAHEYIDTTKVEAGAGLRALGSAALIVTTNPHADQIPELLNGLGPLGKLLVLSRKDHKELLLQEEHRVLTACLPSPRRDSLQR